MAKREKREQEFSVIKSCGWAHSPHCWSSHVCGAPETLFFFFLLLFFFFSCTLLPRSSLSFYLTRDPPTQVSHFCVYVLLCVSIRCVCIVSTALSLCLPLLVSFHERIEKRRWLLTAALLYSVNWLTENEELAFEKMREGRAGLGRPRRS